MFALAPAIALGAVQVRNCSIVVQPGATAQDRHAAEELRDHLAKIVEHPISLIEAPKHMPGNVIVVGQGPLARELVPNGPWGRLGSEQTYLKSVGNRLVVAGGGTRGTLYAVYRLLGEKCGVRWWAPWATTIPHNPKLKLGAMDWSETPAFEYRDPYWFHAFDADWAARNFDNGWNTRVDDARGGKTAYEGFVHTYYGLVPPDKYFATHPEWYSLINGKRTWVNAQLCTTNPQLRAFVLEQVRERLRKNPLATIVSVSQNDCFNPCQCPVCRALAEREGSDAALVLDLANYVADGIRDEFPNVAVDTLAYQWSRHPVRSMRPKQNVIVRLCSIECNFAQPLYAPSNAAFSDDIKGWSRLTQRLYVWDYCTNFAHYLQPQPDYFSLPQSIRWFAENGVKGVFEEGDYQSNAGDMAELKAWVTAQMLWNPRQDPSRLVDEFLSGYYGPAADPIRKYLDLMAAAAQGTHVSFALGTDAPFLNYATMRKADGLWKEAERATEGTEYLARVRTSELSPTYVWLTHWRGFRAAANAAKEPWPRASTRQAEADAWLRTAKGYPGYSSVVAVNEGMLTPESFVASLGPEPSLPSNKPLPPRTAPAPPYGLGPGMDFQDDLASLWQVPDGSELRADPAASDGISCWMPGDHHEWAFQMPLSRRRIAGKYRVYVVVRAEVNGPGATPAFSAGVYDNASRQVLKSLVFTAGDLGRGYRAFELGRYDIRPELTVWVAPPANPAVSSVWVDRVYLVPAP